MCFLVFLSPCVFLPKKDTKNPLGKLVGFLADAALGAGLGVGYVYVLKFTGKDHALMKGVGYGHGAWTLVLGGTQLVGGPKIPQLNPKSVLSTYAEHALYGAGAALVATALGDEDLFQKEDIEGGQFTKNSLSPSVEGENETVLQ